MTEQYGLVLSDVLSAAAIERLESRLTSELTAGRTATEALSAAIEAGGLMPFSTDEIMSRFFERLGVRAAGADFEAFVRGEESTVERVMMGLLVPNVLSNEEAESVFDEMFETVKYGLGSGRITLEDADIYIGGENASINGSAERDMIFAGAGSTVSSGAGDDTVVLTSGEGAVTVNDEISPTITGLTEALAAYIDRATFEDAHTREYIGLSSVSAVNVIGFETGFDGTSDVIMVDDVNGLQFAFDGSSVEVNNGGGLMRFATTSDVGVDVMLQSGDGLMKATAINGGQSIAGTGADYYFLGDGARQYVEVNGDATVYGFDAGTVASSDVLFTDAPYTLRADDNGIVIENEGGSVLLAGVNADALIMIGDEIASIESGDDTTSETPIDDTTSEVPIDDTTSEAPIDDTTSEVPVDTDRFVDNSADDIDVTLTSAKVGVIESEATGSKIVTAGDRMTTLENYAASADVTLKGSARNDLIIAVGGNQVIDLSLGGRDTIDIDTGSIDVVGYDVTTKSGFAVDGVLTFDGNGFAGDDFRVVLDGDHSRGVFAAFIDEDGNRQLYGWNDAEAVIDGSAYDQSQHLISEGWSTVIGGSKDDTIEATGGDIIQLTRGHDLIVIDDRASGEVMIDLGTHLTHTTVEGFSAGDIVKVEDVHTLKVKDTDDGLSIRAGNAHLMLDGVSDTVRVTDGNNEFVLRTDYRDLVPTAAYMLEDQSGIVRTPNGTLEIDDDIFTFNGGDNVAIDGFDDRWQLRAGDGVEVDRMTTLVNGTIQITTTDGGRLKVRK